MSRPLTVALVAGESSGDILGAGLMQALKVRHPDVEFVGVGGARMEAEGLKSYFPLERLAVMGLVEVLGRLPELLSRRKRLLRTLLDVRPDVFIGIDAPDFNLDLELKLRRAGIKTVHYVSPSVWAWRQKRVLKIRDGCDLMLTLFPFEAKFYDAHQVAVRFVGHPLADAIPLCADRDAARALLNLPTDAPIVALMPGSRGGEVARLGSLFLDAAERLRGLRPGIRFVMPCASPERRTQLEQMLAGRDLPLTLIDGRSHEALAACDAVLIASGTATLEALLYKRPMVVAYRVAPLTFSILKRMVKSAYVSLPNLLAQRLLVPELLQEAATPEAMAQLLSPLLEHGEVQTEGFDEIHRTLRRDASSQAADAVLELVGRP
ncbi:lipid-A-disaccharide synthase [Stutzerimonas nitrititolerans]|uniref:lipid-A-disaccharide synthase n=1 Tax=Stutzerimonas nitrititolerans TaxID=2482751 RepID=UPI0007185335|nr:lipid-A-disaccharide synthase [Stutzerimonas nitrititolerans]KRW69202.1 lipid-A-disaccharide synthase [Pseudomonas sp. TTU2014-066ASC]KRW72860.1 lipid-A-disaccharide synthase [Pseudomonas sp. TTU2014-096BSC]MBT1118382.1 lipid-A-disaccharide synthase [Stutzerimonas nitrititolerans]HAQ27184.1 lipid-A-disaccharide synthase [Pseudomonas sp.]